MKKLNEQTKNKYIQELIKFCAQPSIAAESRGMDEMVQTVLAALQTISAKCEVVSVAGSFKYILADLKAPKDSNSKRTVLIYNHYDVQPEAPLDEWESAPFVPTLRDGKLFARGVADNKGDLLARIQAVRQLLDETGDLPVNIKWLIEGEEEIGSPHLKNLQEKHGNFWKDADVCIWEEGWVDGSGAPIMPLGMKGILCVELECSFNKSDLHSRNAVLVDSPVWRLIQALNTLRDTKGNVTLDGFYEHALTPTKAELKLMQETDFDVSMYMEGVGGEKALEKDSSHAQERLYFKGSANICGIWGGYTEPTSVKTIVPNKATVKLDFRLVANQDPADILAKLRKHLDKRGFTDVLIIPNVSLMPTKTSIDNVYVEKCLNVLKREYKVPPVIEITSLGGGPTYNVAAVYDIPVVKIGVGYPGSRMHAPNENIRLDDYFKAMEVFIEYLFEVAK